MPLLVMPAAEPDDIYWPGVILVVALNFLAPAHFAWLALKSAVLEGSPNLPICRALEMGIGGSERDPLCARLAPLVGVGPHDCASKRLALNVAGSREKRSPNIVKSSFVNGSSTSRRRRSKGIVG